ncbi:MAG TPA: family 16 glycoside hydrolase [Fibrobacteria bacterium]|nr:family 16 glycoside hydrolase [Fibrobacteria bacterium]
MNAFASTPMLTLAALLALPAPGPAQTVNYRGRVVDKVGMAAVVGATVKAGSLTATTGADGRFTLQGDPGPTAIGSQGSVRSETPVFALQGRSLRVQNRQAGQSLRLEWVDGNGRQVGGSSRRLETVEAFTVDLGSAGADFAGFLRVTLAGETRTFRVTSVAGVAVGSIPGGGNESGLATSARAAAKGAAVEVSVTMAKLLPKSVTPAANDADLGDIVLDYPPRKLGLDSPPIYGADVLFPMAAGDSAATRTLFENLWVHKMNSWRTSKGMGNTPVLWKVVQEPLVAAGSPFKATLSPCCEPRNGSPNWGYDDIITKKEYGDFQLHLEFNMMGPNNGNTDASGYCNSGVYVKNGLELQIETPKNNSNTDLHGLATLLNIKLPDKNMYPGPGKWQSYDVTLRAPRADSPAKVTVFWNGELVHNNQSWKAAGAVPKVGFALQNELGSDVRYRNVWLKELDIKEPLTNFGY